MTAIRSQVWTMPLERGEIVGSTARARTYSRPADLAPLPPDSIFALRLDGACGAWVVGAVTRDGPLPTDRSLRVTDALVVARDDARALLELYHAQTPALRAVAIALDGQRAIAAQMVDFLDRIYRAATDVRRRLAEEAREESPFSQQRPSR